MIDGVRIQDQTPYALQCIDRNQPIEVALDDMAQIIGGPVRIVEEDDLAIFNALKDSAGVMVKCRNPYAIATGRNKEEAQVAMAVLEKAAQVQILSQAIGGVYPLSSINIRKQRNKYLNKYSKLKDAHNIDDQGPTDEVKHLTADNDNAGIPSGDLEATIGEIKARQSLVDYGNKLLEKHLVEGTWGNISARIGGDAMMVTPSGQDYSKCGPQDMVRVSLETGEYSKEENKPTTEVELHRGIYNARPDVGGIIHTHSIYCSVFAACRMPLDIVDPELRENLGDLVNISEYGYAGSSDLTKNVINALGEKVGCIIANHGMICCGSTLEEAFDRSLAMEEAARKFLMERI